MIALLLSTQQHWPNCILLIYVKSLTIRYINITVCKYLLELNFHGSLYRIDISFLGIHTPNSSVCVRRYRFIKTTKSLQSIK